MKLYTTYYLRSELKSCTDLYSVDCISHYLYSQCFFQRSKTILSVHACEKVKGACHHFNMIDINQVQLSGNRPAINNYFIHD